MTPRPVKRKKVGVLHKQGDQEGKRTNEIKTIIPLLDFISIEGKVITVDALLTQSDLVDYLVLKRNAHYHFTVKGNQPTLLADIEFYLRDRKEPDFIQKGPSRSWSH
jgi:predicted transposase YbfD/YdcC